MPTDGPRPHPRPGASKGTPPREPARAEPPSPRPSRLDEAVREKVRALPGSLTFLDLIRKNKRDSVVLIVVMILLGTLVGGAIGGLAVPLFVGLEDSGMVYQKYAETARQDPMTADYDSLSQDAARAPARIFGLDAGVFRDTALVAKGASISAGIMLLVTGIGALWAWYGGSNAMLRMVHAREITRELDPELFNVVDEMRLAAGIPMPRIYLIPESALNAFATGRDPEHGVVAITAGLRAKLTRDELQGVMAHEIAHIRHLDIRFGMLMAMMVGLIVVACDIMIRVAWHGGWASAGRHSRNSKRSGGAIVIILMVGAVVLGIIAPLLAQIIQMAYSRKREYLADAGAAELTRNPEGLASALRKLAEDSEPTIEMANRGTAHMYITNPLRTHKSRHEKTSLFSSHPPVADRIAKLIALTR